MVGNYDKLEIFQLAYKFVLDLYPQLDKFPENENPNLIIQMKRAAVSMPLNIAEGSSRRKDREFLPFLSYALGSAKEIEVSLRLSKDLGFISEDNFNGLDKQLQIFLEKLLHLMHYLEDCQLRKKEVYMARISRGEKPW